MRDQGLGSWPRRRARMTPGKAALVQDGTPMSYGDLDRAVTRAGPRTPRARCRTR